MTETYGDELRRKRKEGKKIGGPAPIEPDVVEAIQDGVLIQFPLAVYDLDWLFDSIFPAAIREAQESERYSRHRGHDNTNSFSEELQNTRERWLIQAREEGYMSTEQRRGAREVIDLKSQISTLEARCANLAEIVHGSEGRDE